MMKNMGEILWCHADSYVMKTLDPLIFVFLASSWHGAWLLAKKFSQPKG